MRRATVWGDIAPTSSTISAASTALLFTGFSAATLALRPFTIVRFRGLLSIASDQAASSEFQQARFGASIVSEESLAIGVTAVPVPVSDADNDMFFVFADLVNRMEVSSAIGIWQNAVVSEFDSRAMRKVEDGQDIALCLETTASSAGIRVSKQGRFLLKLH